MVGGPASVDPGPPLDLTGDPYLQRQNEVSLACSSRNPLNCFAAANDYRTVDIPGFPEDRETGDAWLGLFWTRTGGQSWRSALLPGFPQDVSQKGLDSPISGFDAAADPTVRAGTSGLFYVSGIAFDREPVGSESSGTEGKSGVVFVSTFIDDNNTEAADVPPRRVRTVVVDDQNGSKFLDKPWIVVDIPRPGGGSCTILGEGGLPDQTVPAGAVYLAYTSFQESPNKISSRLLITRSTDCGATWEKPVALSGPGRSIYQSASLAIHPQTGRVTAAWREFDAGKSKNSGRILVTTALDSPSGRLRFGRPTEVVDLGKGTLADSLAFDQPALPNDEEPSFRAFRTNSYPSLCIDGTGLAHLAWSQRGYALADPSDSRIVVSRSMDTVNWTPPVPIDNHAGRGHQVMPALSCTANRVTAVWYDQRYDNASVFGPGAFGFFVADPIPPPPAHTLDVRAAQAIGGGAFGDSRQISRYELAYDLSSEQVLQFEFNAENLPLFAGGTLPFLGDYLDLASMRPFDPPSDGGNWTFNSDPDQATVFQAAWADNRDIPPNPADDWMSWAAPGTALCGAGVQTQIRNQNIYATRVSNGLDVGILHNNRLLDATIQRGFAVYVRNLEDPPALPAPQTKWFRLTASQPVGGRASFQQRIGGNPDPLVDTVDIEIGALSSAARTLFVNSSDPRASVTVEVVEVTGPAPGGSPVPGGLRGTAVINPDPTAPPSLDPQVAAANELHSLLVSDPLITTFTNPNNLSPTFLNPTVVSLSPTFLNPTYVTLSPTFLNPTVLTLSPTFLNPSLKELSPTFLNEPVVTEATWTVTNTGNVATVFDVRTLFPNISPDFIFQLIIYRLFEVPVVDPNDACLLDSEQRQELLVDVVGSGFIDLAALSPTFLNPDFLVAAYQAAVLDPSAAHGTVAIPAGESVQITVQVIGDTTFDVGDIQVVVASTAVDSMDADAGVSMPAHSAPAPTPSVSPQRVDHTAALLLASTGNPATAGKILVTGGFDVDSLDSSGLLDPDTGLFSPTASLSEARTRATATRLLNGTVLVAGGVGAVTPTGGADVYDPSTGTFANVPGAEAFRYDHTATLLNSGEVLLAGGLDGVTGNEVSSAATYDPVAQTFSPVVGNMTAARTRHSATLLPGGNVLIIGGGNEDPTVSLAVPNVEEYDSSSETFSSRAGAMIQPRNGHTAALLTTGPNAGNVLVTGGLTATATATTGTEIYDVALDSFSAGPNLATGRTAHTQTVLPSGRVLLLGGTTASGGILADAEMYVPESNIFMRLLPLAFARELHTANLLPDGRVAVVGGRGPGGTFDFPPMEFYPAPPDTAPRIGQTTTKLSDGRILIAGGGPNQSLSSTVDTAELYDPVNDSFTPTGSLAEGRVLATATLLTTGDPGSVLVTGGSNSTGTLDGAELYDPATGSFASLASTMTAPRSAHTATRLLNGLVLIAGGNDSGVPMASAEIYDPVAGTFTPTGSMNKAREYFTATLLGNGRVLVTGGISAHGPQVTESSAELYDPAGGTFTLLGDSMDNARWNHRAVRLLDGRVLVVGGSAGVAGPAGDVTDVEVYDPSTGLFMTTASIPQPQLAPAVTLLPGGDVLVMGGSQRDPFEEISAVEIYDPTAHTMTPAADLVLPRWYHDAVLLDTGPNAGRVLVIGGGSYAGYFPAAIATGPEIYTPPTP